MMELIRMVVVLSLLTGTAGLALSGLKVWTDPIIEGQVMTYVQGPALLQIFADADNDPIADRKKLPNPENPEEQIVVFPALKGGALQAVAIETSAGGFGGDIGVMVGIDVASDNLAGISITTHKETPGLGSRTAEPGFTRQFIGHGKDVALSSKGGDIDAVSGATISSTGVVEAVNKAVNLYAQLAGDIKKTW